MNKSLKFFAVVVFIFIQSRLPAQQDGTILKNNLDKLIDSVYEASKVPGIIVGIWSPDFTYKKVTGKSDIKTGQDRNFDDKIRIGSITKTFVATVILQLADDGKLGLDDKLSKYYPDYPDAENITVRQMLDMTSGIPDYIEDPKVLKSFVYDRLDKYTPLELYDITKAMKPYFPPGKGWKYSNGNYNILGMMIETITGNKIEDEIYDRIISPLGLKNTLYPVTPYMEGLYSHGYMRDTLSKELMDVTLISPSITWAAGCMISDVNDLRIYADALANGTMISRQMQTERLKFVNSGVADYVKYGLGIFSLGGFIGHNGGITGYNTTMCNYPLLNTTIIVSVNEYGADGGISDHIFKLVADKLYPDNNFFGK